MRRIRYTFAFVTLIIAALTAQQWDQSNGSMQLSSSTTTPLMIVNQQGSGQIASFRLNGVEKYGIGNGGQQLAGDGTAGTPAYSFASDPDNGMYYSNSATAKTRFSFDGSFVLGINATGVTFGGDTDLLRGAANRLDLATGDSFSIVSGGLGVGTTNTVAGTISTSGAITSIAGITSAGTTGVPVNVAVGRFTAQAAAKASVATFTVGAADASFEVSANILITTATTHSFTATVAYTDEGNTARTATLNFATLAGVISNAAITNVAGAVPYEGVPYHIRCKAATAITIATTGTFTTVVYNVEGIIKQIS